MLKSSIMMLFVLITLFVVHLFFLPYTFFYINFLKIIINLFIYYLFIFGCVGSSFLCEGFLKLWQVGATLHRGARASHCHGLSCCGAQALDVQAQ